MPTWRVNIVDNPTEAFVAELQAAPVGRVYADAGDAVYWNNTTAQTHQISLLLATSNQGVVLPGKQSDAFFVTGNSGDTIPYNCVLHPTVTGTIVVT